MTANHIIHRGHNATTEYLLTVWDDGTVELATRPVFTTATWSPPIRLQRVPAEVTC